MRHVLKLSLALVLFTALTAFAQQDNFSKVQIKVTHVAGTVYMLEGAGGNIGASIGDDGIVVVDDEFAPLAEKIKAALKGVSDKPIRFVINTHYHGDHTGGNTQFQSNATPIIAQDNVRKRLANGGKAGNGGSMTLDQKAQPAAALPVVTFAHDATVHLNGEDIHAMYFPSGHTDGDSIVFFPQSNVVHMGDDFVTYGFPFVDISAGGSVEGIVKACEEVLAKVPADVKIIPGHGPLSKPDDVRSFVKMIRETRAVVEKNLKAGKTLEQMKKDKVLEPWKKYSGDFISSDAWIETLYNELTGKKDAKFMKHN